MDYEITSREFYWDEGNREDINSNSAKPNSAKPFEFDPEDNIPY